MGGGSGGGGGGGGSSYSLYSVFDQGFNIGDGYAVLVWDWMGPSVAPTLAPSATPTASSSVGPTTSSPTTLLFSPLELTFTGEVQIFTVPFGVSSITVTLYGGSGQNGLYSPGGRGAMIKSTIPVSHGEKLLLVIGSSGKQRYNGGGKGGNGGSRGGGGGGATDIRRGLYSLSDRILIAGGGGGAGGYYDDATGGDGAIRASEYDTFTIFYCSL